MAEMTQEQSSSLSLSTVSPSGPPAGRHHNHSVFRPEEATMTDSQMYLLLETLHDETLSNWTGSFDDPVFDYLNIPLVMAAVLLVYTIVIVISVCGNTVVVYAVVRHRRLRTSTNTFIVCLAVSDIVLSVFSLPVQLHYQLTNRWVFGEALCRAVFALFAIPMYVSTLMILLIAADRYRRVICRQPLTPCAACALVVAGVVASCMLAVPVVTVSTLHDLDDADLRIRRRYCVEEWPNEPLRLGYALVTFIGQFGVPLAVSAALYWRIYRRLKRRRPPSGHIPGNRRHMTTRILAGVVAVFVVCWTPWNIHSLLTEFFFDSVGGPHFKFVDLLLKVFALSSAAINPFLYCWLNANFRQELESVASRCQVCGFTAKTPDSRAAVAEAVPPAVVTLRPRDGNIPQRCDQPDEDSIRKFHGQQAQHQINTMDLSVGVDRGNELPQPQSSSSKAIASEFQQLQTTLAMIEHRSTSSASSRSTSNVHPQTDNC